MAQQDDTQGMTNASNPPRPQNSPGSKSSTTQTSPNCQNLQDGGSSWSPKSSSKAKQNHEQDGHGIHHHKKSVFTKVKEKARKLKKSISGRKRREENDITPPGSAGSFDDDKNQPEYFGSPLYEPKEHSQESNKGSSNTPENKSPSLDSNETNIDSKQSGLSLLAHEDNETAKPDSSSMQDKGVSVKEYIMHKLEPGEDERALSQAITQTISPKCEKVKEAVNSILGNEEASSSSSESNGNKLASLTNDPNPSNTLEPNLSNASQGSTSTSTSLQNQNPASSNLKPDSG